MGRKRYTAEQIIHKLCEVKVLVRGGAGQEMACKWTL